METWAKLGKATSPVNGDPSEFHALAEDFSTMSKGIESLQADFFYIGRSNSLQFRGATANAFDAEIRSIEGQLMLVPTIARQISNILAEHGRQLLELRRDTASALERAEANWTNRQEAEGQISHYRKRIQSLTLQIESVRSERSNLLGLNTTIYDPRAEEQARLERQRYTHEQELRVAQMAANRAEERLDVSRREWNTLREREESLEAATSKQLDGVYLGDFADPSWGELLFPLLFPGTGLLFPGTGTLIYLLYKGDLEKIHKNLRLLRNYLEWTAFILLILVLLAACTFPPALKVLIPLFGIVSAALMAISAAAVLVALIQVDKGELDFKDALWGDIVPLVLNTSVIGNTLKRFIVVANIVKRLRAALLGDLPNIGSAFKGIASFGKKASDIVFDAVDDILTNSFVLKIKREVLLMIKLADTIVDLLEDIIPPIVTKHGTLSARKVLVPAAREIRKVRDAFEPIIVDPMAEVVQVGGRAGRFVTRLLGY